MITQYLATLWAALEKSLPWRLSFLFTLCVLLAFTAGNIVTASYHMVYHLMTGMVSFTITDFLLFAVSQSTGVYFFICLTQRTCMLCNDQWKSGKSGYYLIDLIYKPYVDLFLYMWKRWINKMYQVGYIFSFKLYCYLDFNSKMLLYLKVSCQACLIWFCILRPSFEKTWYQCDSWRSVLVLSYWNPRQQGQNSAVATSNWVHILYCPSLD